MFQILTVFYFVCFFIATRLYFSICYSVMDESRFKRSSLSITSLINTIIFTIITTTLNVNPSVIYILLLICSMIEIFILFKNNILGNLMYSLLMLIVIVCIQSITIATGFLIVDANLSEVFSNHLLLFLLIDISWFFVMLLIFFVHKFVSLKYLRIINQNKEQVLFVLGFLCFAIIYLTLNSFIYANAISFTSHYIFIHQIITPFAWLGVVSLAIALLIRFDYLHGYKVKSDVLQQTVEDQNTELIKTKNIAERDSLVDVYNKRAIETKIEESLDAINQGAFFILDIDDFKTINDTKGHPFGDKVLIYLAKRIENTFRGDDLVGRIGGDEFVVFVKNAPSVEMIESKADELCKDINIPFSDKQGETVLVSISVGIAMYPQHGNSFKELYKNADTALYLSKKRGKNTYSLFSK